MIDWEYERSRCAFPTEDLIPKRDGIKPRDYPLTHDSASVARHVEQPAPNITDGPCIQDIVIEDIKTRKKVGIERYGTPLQAFNGRDALRDAYEEVLDLAQYLRQIMVERDQTAVKYQELIYSVGNKYEGESRHQTALRYIRQAERSNGNATAKETK